LTNNKDEVIHCVLAGKCSISGELYIQVACTSGRWVKNANTDLCALDHSLSTINNIDARMHCNLMSSIQNDREASGGCVLF